MRQLVGLSLLLTMAGCLHAGGDDACRTNALVEFQYDKPSSTADMLRITLGGSAHNPFTVPRVPGQSQDTLDIDVGHVPENEYVAMTIEAFAGSVMVGKGKTSILPACPLSEQQIPIKAATGADRE
jgi:hypothetical protein